MNRCLATCLVALGSLATATCGQAQEPPTSPPTPTIIVPVGPHDPTDVAQTLNNVFASDIEIGFAPVTEQSMLIVRCPTERQDEVMQVIQSLTPAVDPIWVRMLHLHPASNFSEQERARLSGPAAQVFTTVEEMSSSGRLQLAHDVEMTLMPGMQGRLQLGEQVARRTGTMRMQMGGNREVAQYEWTQVGTLVMIRAESERENVELELKFESTSQRDTPPDEHGSAPGADQESSDRDASQAPSGIGTLSIDSSLRLPSGRALMLSGISSNRLADSTSHHLFVVAAEIRSPKP